MGQDLDITIDITDEHDPRFSMLNGKGIRIEIFSYDDEKIEKLYKELDKLGIRTISREEVYCG